MKVVLDTNVLVSALWSAGSKPSYVLGAVLTGKLTPCYDLRILQEYSSVLHRPKFGFSEWEISSLLDPIRRSGLCVIPTRLPELPFTDESDRKFLETAKYCHAVLITGNTKHYPPDPCVVTVSDFYDRLIGAHSV